MARESGRTARPLPERALIDTGVLIRALGDRRRDPDAEACKHFFDEMRRARKPLLVAAPSIAEIIRGASTPPPPNIEGVEVVAFDGYAAHLLGTRVPHNRYVQLQKETGLPSSYFKYDALIAACALRHRAEAVVSLDGGLRTLARELGLYAYEPHEFLAPQLKLPDI